MFIVSCSITPNNGANIREFFVTAKKMGEKLLNPCDITSK